jgi:hypothetical protein
VVVAALLLFLASLLRLVFQKRQGAAGDKAVQRGAAR